MIHSSPPAIEAIPLRAEGIRGRNICAGLNASPPAWALRAEHPAAFLHAVAFLACAGYEHDWQQPYQLIDGDCFATYKRPGVQLQFEKPKRKSSPGQAPSGSRTRAKPRRRTLRTTVTDRESGTRVTTTLNLD